MKIGAVGIWALALGAFPQGADTLSVGVQIPDFKLQDTAGQTYQLSTILKKPGIKGVLLTVYASDCGYCAADMPKMQQTYRSLRSKGLRWIGLSIDVSKSAAEKFVKQHKLTLINLHDADKTVARSLGYSRTPHSVLVDKHRKVVRVYAGTSADLLEQMKADLTQFLATGKVTSTAPVTGGG